LTPKIQSYLNSFTKGFDAALNTNVRLSFIMSDGGLVKADGFSGEKAIMSGPAGGVVGYAKTTYSEKDKIPIIGFDMGGTSTDVSRYDGRLELVFETVTAGVAIQA
jgi:5-oxoprolinase (ATP-hydrolysing)